MFISLIIIIVAIYILVMLGFGIKLLVSINKGKGEDVEASYKNSNDLLEENILNVLPGGSSPQNLQIAKKIKDMVNEESPLITQEIKQKYERVLKEKEEEYRTVETKCKNLLTEKRQTETVIRSMTDGLIVVNNKGEVVMMNPAAEKILDVTKETQKGKPLSGYITDKQLVSLAKNKEQGEDGEIELSSGDDETKKTIRSSSAVIENADGQTIGMVSVLTDITKQKELDRMKSQFLAGISHELRTPIFAVRNSITLIVGKSYGPLTPDQEKFLNIANRNLERLSMLINQLLDMSKLEEKKMELRLENNSIKAVIDETCDSLRAWAQTKEVAITKTLEEDLPQFKFDALRVNQILTNLIGNAIKFTPKKGLILLGAKMSADKKFIEVSVSDNGMGITKEDLPKLFTKFTQVGSHSNISGTGLGLALSKELVELHGGKIWVESVIEKGTVFTFSLPVTNY